MELTLTLTLTLALTPAQVVLQWNLRHGVAVVPKCSSHTHAIELLQVCDLAAISHHLAYVHAPDHTHAIELLQANLPMELILTFTVTLTLTPTRSSCCRRTARL